MNCANKKDRLAAVYPNFDQENPGTLPGDFSQEEMMIDRQL